MPRILVYPARMPRKAPDRSGLAAHQPDWFLPEWMASLRVTQADLCRETGLNKSTMSEIKNGKTSYYRALVNQMSRALRIEPFELLMHPDEAFALRRLREGALRIAAEQKVGWKAFPQDNAEAAPDDQPKRRTSS